MNHQKRYEENLVSRFKSPWDYQSFANAVRTERRFLHTTTVRTFLDAVNRGSQERKLVVPVGKIFSRAQVGCDEWSRTNEPGRRWVEEVPFKPQRMIPLSRNVPEGRINPRGIGYLYLATDAKTAIAEVRPSVGTPVTVAQFETTKQLTLVDLSRETRRKGPPVTGLMWYASVAHRIDELSQQEIDQSVWAQIDNAFSHPVDPHDEYLNYVPTQVIAELLAEKKYDGVIYGSGLNTDGYNIALFDVKSAKFLNAQLYRVDGVDYNFHESSNLWFLKDGQYVTTVITDIRPVDSKEPRSTQSKQD